MAELYAKSVIDLAYAQVGYQANGKYNKYAEELDSVNFYNTKKNGYADWCAIFVDWLIYKNTDPMTAHNARQLVYEPDNDNCGAGCTQKVQYYKSHGAWVTNVSKAQSGDQIFFKKSNGVVYHTGYVVTWDSKGFYVVEGNTNGGKVAKKFYSFGDEKIAGFGRPNYTGWEEPKPEPTPSPDPEPTPTPTPDPKPMKTKSGMVRVNTVLNVRSAPTTNAPVVKQLKDQTIVTIYETKNGWDRIGSNEWANNTWIKEGKEYTVQVKSYLNVRCGPGVVYGVVGKKYNGNKVIVYEIKNGFGHIGSNQWVSMTYLR